jgi:hypothetical protein
MSDLEDEFLSHAMAQVHPFVRECAGSALAENLCPIVRTDVERIGSSDFAQWHSRGREGFGVPPEAFNNRLIEIGLVRLIAGIRFRNRDSRFPFVGIEQSSIPLGTLADHAPLLRELAAAFAPFRPQSLNVFHSSHLSWRIASARPDYHLLMAPARTMNERAPPDSIDRVTLVACRDLDSYDRYVALYEDIFAERPWARAVLRVEDRASLALSGGGPPVRHHGRRRLERHRRWRAGRARRHRRHRGRGYRAVAQRARRGPRRGGAAPLRRSRGAA